MQNRYFQVKLPTPLKIYFFIYITVFFIAFLLLTTSFKVTDNCLWGKIYFLWKCILLIKRLFSTLQCHISEILCLYNHIVESSQVCFFNRLISGCKQKLRCKMKHLCHCWKISFWKNCFSRFYWLPECWNNSNYIKSTFECVYVALNVDQWRTRIKTYLESEDNILNF